MPCASWGRIHVTFRVLPQRGWGEAGRGMLFGTSSFWCGAVDFTFPPSLGWAWPRLLSRGAISALPDALTASPPAFFPLLPSLPLFCSLLISTASTWEKLDRFYFIMIIHISKIENSQMRVPTVTVKHIICTCCLDYARMGVLSSTYQHLS